MNMIPRHQKDYTRPYRQDILQEQCPGLIRALRRPPTGRQPCRPYIHPDRDNTGSPSEPPPSGSEEGTPPTILRRIRARLNSLRWRLRARRCIKRRRKRHELHHRRLVRAFVQNRIITKQKRNTQ